MACCKPQVTARAIRTYPYVRLRLLARNLWFSLCPSELLARLAGAAFILLTGLHPALAAPAEDLQQTQESLKQSEQRIEKLQQDSAGLERELAALRKQLVEVSDAVREREVRLLTLEEEQQQLQQEVTAIQTTLEQREEEISHLVQSLIKLSRVPPEAVVAMPGELRHTLQAADLLGHLTSQIKQRTRQLNLLLRRLEQNHASLQKTHRRLSEEKEQMEQAQLALSEQLGQRKQLYRQLNRQQEDEKAKMAELSSASKSLQDLLDQLARKQSEQRQQHARLSAVPQVKPTPPARSAPWKKTVQEPQAAKLKQPGLPSSFAAARGKLRLPVVGKITNHFGEKRGKNQTHRGVTVAGRNGTQVVAPFGGEVVFTGAFMDYGPMVILRYGRDYHLLLAGLGQIDCVVGQHIAGGEPVGRLGGGSQPRLYIELRHQSNPVDPMPWFG